MEQCTEAIKEGSSLESVCMVSFRSKGRSKCHAGLFQKHSTRRTPRIRHKAGEQKGCLYYFPLSLPTTKKRDPQVQVYGTTGILLLFRLPVRALCMIFDIWSPKSTIPALIGALLSSAFFWLPAT